MCSLRDQAGRSSWTMSVIFASKEITCPTTVVSTLLTRKTHPSCKVSLCGQSIRRRFWCGLPSMRRACPTPFSWKARVPSMDKHMCRSVWRHGWFPLLKSCTLMVITCFGQTWHRPITLGQHWSFCTTKTSTLSRRRKTPQICFHCDLSKNSGEFWNRLFTRMAGRLKTSSS